MRIEPAVDRHVPAIAAIYEDAAVTSAATFDLEGLPDYEWRSALADVDPATGKLLLVALDDDDGVLGYAKSGPHRPRPAYDTTCETSVYVARDAQGRGVGGALYDVLLERLEASPLRLAVAGMTEPNEASRRLHLSRGFTYVGTFTGIGTKFGRSWDVSWYQRPLSHAP
jgi:phosphinothricin acetyltransferase